MKKRCETLKLEHVVGEKSKQVVAPVLAGAPAGAPVAVVVPAQAVEQVLVPALAAVLVPAVV